MLEKLIHCPGCGVESMLIENTNDIYINRIGKYISVDMLSYDCKFCNESYTTTESDTITLNRINSKIRSEVRKDRINKLI
jgi:Zn finger protein HypA/HybF involved in hydrogenase expression